MVAAVEATAMLRCPRCGQVVALRDDESGDWQPLGARVKRRPSDRGRSSFVCPVCGTMKRIPDDQRDGAEPAA